MNFTVFQYPKSKHTRSLAPRLFKRYQTYKRYLQHEFSRTCVYCRQPDSSAPNLNFGVDHYRPKGIPKFASLECNYQNLYYCCGSCNSRKNNDWPKDESKGPYIVNPCDYIMSQHLRFESTKGTMATRTKFGEYTEDLLQLNDPTQVEYRKTTLAILKMAAINLTSLNNQKTQIIQLFQQNTISADIYDDEIGNIDDEIKTIETFIQNNTGSKPLLRVRNLK
ncbi:hypothetical protein [Pseudomonas sp. COW5]|uniref:hypothetical protein n=1 Tax=Pseudomonas sp. COW5 TaxID=2981253 RepID=UPI002247884A|nr:hypothetical protein [Pseudomonas sp. COW5]MCX2545365.1 hypothetical protein [Pseudomonas sp. COW5]